MQKNSKAATAHAARVFAAEPKAAAQFNTKEQAALKNYLAKAFDSALRPQFVGIRRAVMLQGECVAVAKSKTFAKRIANALNKHVPNREGV